MVIQMATFYYLVMTSGLPNKQMRQILRIDLIHFERLVVYISYAPFEPSSIGWIHIKSH
jgi:hypothetical protein